MGTPPNRSDARAVRLTDRAVAALAPDPDGRYEVWDVVVPGLSVRVTPAGIRSFCISYRVAGDRRKRRRTLGRYPAMPLGDARRQARETLEAAAEGRDLGEAAMVAAGGPSSKLSWGQLVDRFLEAQEARGRRPSTITDQRSLLQSQLGDWRSLPAGAVDVEEAARRLSRLAARAPVRARHFKSTLSQLAKFARRTRDPETGDVLAPGLDFPDLHVPPPPPARERVLSPAEIQAVWAALERVGEPWASFVKMLFYTLQRRDEVAGMAAAEIAAVHWPERRFRGTVWTVPAGRSKNGEPSLVPLSAAARIVLARRPPAASGGLYFPSRAGPERPISGFSKMKRTLDAASGVEGWRLHDIRRTGATRMAEMGISPTVADRILNHVQLSGLSPVARVYQRYDFLAERHEALRRWAIWLRSIGCRG